MASSGDGLGRCWRQQLLKSNLSVVVSSSRIAQRTAWMAMTPSTSFWRLNGMAPDFPLLPTCNRAAPLLATQRRR
jgi:hypothetical protein